MASEHENEEHPYHIEGTLPIFDKPNENEEASKEKRDREAHEFQRAQVATSQRMLAFNILLFFATLFSTLIAVWQAAISHSAADTAEKTLYVTSSPSIDVSPPQYEPSGGFQVIVVNNGHSLAKNTVLTWYMAVHRTEPIAPPLDPSKVPQNSCVKFVGNLGDISPSTPKNISLFIVGDPNNVAAERLEFTVAGEVSYRDTFSNRPEQHTPFCYSKGRLPGMDKPIQFLCELNAFLATHKNCPQQQPQQ